MHTRGLLALYRTYKFRKGIEHVRSHHEGIDRFDCRQRGSSASERGYLVVLRLSYLMSVRRVGSIIAAYLARCVHAVHIYTIRELER